jgi:hypothetical protein
VRRTFQLIVCMIVVGFAAPRTTSADPIAITKGTITLPANFATAPTTLSGTDGAHPFTFHGVISTDAIIGPYTSCEPCTTQVSIAIHAVLGVSGDVTYGSERYRVGPGLLDTDGDLNLDVQGGPIALPKPAAIGQLRTFTAPFTASGTLTPPFFPGGLANTLSGSGRMTITLAAGPSGVEQPTEWSFRSAEYRFNASSGGPAPVPEPASFLLFGSGISALVLRRRSRAR